LQGFLEGIKYEKPKNAHIGLVYPVATKTGFFTSSSKNSAIKEPWPRQSPDVVAKKIIEGIIKEKERIMPSKMLCVANLIGKFFPGIIRYTLKHQAIEPK
jgi:short-subunit dehydrogenase